MTKNQFIDRVKNLPGVKATPSEVSCFAIALYFVGDSICNDCSKIAEPGDIIFCSGDYDYKIGNHCIRCYEAGNFEEQVTNDDAEELVEIIKSASSIYQDVVTNDKDDVQILLTASAEYVDEFLGCIKNHMTDLKTGHPITPDTEFIKITGAKITDDLMDMVLDMTSDNYAISETVEKNGILFFEDGPELPYEEEEMEFVLEKAKDLKIQCNREIKIYFLADD